MGNVVLFLIRPGIIDLGAFCVELWSFYLSRSGRPSCMLAWWGLAGSLAPGGLVGGFPGSWRGKWWVPRFLGGEMPQFPGSWLGFPGSWLGFPGSLLEFPGSWLEFPGSWGKPPGSKP